MPRITSIAVLRQQLAARQKELADLRAEREEVARRVGTLDRRIAALGGTPTRRPAAKKAIAPAPPPPAKGQRSLASVLADVLQGRGAIKVAEAAKLAIAAGYKSSSSQFGNIVSQTLSNDKRFRKIGRGVYSLKGFAAKAAALKPGKAPKHAAKKATQPASVTATKPGQKVPGLRKLLAQVLAGRKAMGVGEAMAAVLAAGYQTKAKDFRFIVNQTLYRSNEFRKAGRGKYALKG